jgi:hypothetical protein
LDLYFEKLFIMVTLRALSLLSFRQLDERLTVQDGLALVGEEGDVAAT